jgi:ribosomal protein S18 acetylase RimI-like enzyme
MCNVQNPLKDLTFRHPGVDDAQQTHDLMVRCDVSEYGEPDSSLDDLLYDWKRINLNHDAWLAFTPQGDLVGYGAVLPWVGGLRYDFYTDPSWQREDLGQALVARCEERGLSLAQERQETTQVLARTYVAHTNQRDQELVERAGFRRVKYHFQMQVQMETPPPGPQWPAGISVRTFAPGPDDAPVYELIQAAFDWPGRTPPTFEAWQSFMMRPDIFEADLWFLGMSGKDIVGACLCFEYPEYGWVRQLGVAESWRRKGLGTALLRHTFGEFKRRGYDRVGLAVESGNPRAYSFYQKIGMQRVRQYDEYEKPIETGVRRDNL